MKLSKRVNIKELIDPEKLEIEKDNSFPMAYAFELPLDSTPDDIWQSIFGDEWKSSLYTLKRKVTIKGDKLRVITAPEEIEGKIEWVKSLVNSTNKRVEEYNEEIKRREEAKKAERKLQEETIRKMRERLKKK